MKPEEREINWLRDKFSFSKMNCLARCPRKAFYRYVCRKKEEPGEPLLWGRATHAGQEYDNLERIDGKSPRLKHVLDVAADHYMGQQKDEFVRQHKEHLESFWESGERDNIQPVPGTVESKFQLKLGVTPDPDAEPEKKPVLIEGYIDVVSQADLGYMRVVDYKTVARKPSQNQADDSNQMMLYVLGAEADEGQQVAFVKYVKQRATTFVTQPTVLTERRKELMLTFVSDTVNAFRRCLKTGDFPKCAPECHWCGPSCGYYPMCYPAKDVNLPRFVEVMEIARAGTLPKEDWRTERDGKVPDQRGSDVGVPAGDGAEAGAEAGADAAPGSAAGAEAAADSEKET